VALDNITSSVASSHVVLIILFLANVFYSLWSFRNKFRALSEKLFIFKGFSKITSSITSSSIADLLIFITTISSVSSDVTTSSVTADIRVSIVVVVVLLIKLLLGHLNFFLSSLGDFLRVGLEELNIAELTFKMSIVNTITAFGVNSVMAIITASNFVTSLLILFVFFFADLELLFWDFAH
jgi:hypothetical protein